MKTVRGSALGEQTMKRRRKEVLFYIITIFSCLVAMTIVVTAALLIYDRMKEKAKIEEEKAAIEAMGNAEVITYTEDEVNLMLAEAISGAESRTREVVSGQILSTIETNLSEGDTMVATLRPLYPDKVVVVSNGAFHFLPIREDFKKHSLVQENLQVLENGEMQYVQDGQVVSKKGIDVSRYQGDIDWEKVAADGVEYAFIRLGIRGYGVEGHIVLDETFEQNIKGAKAAGVKVGIYFFTQAITEEEALEEANFVLEQVAPYAIDYPIVLDVEKTSAQDGRMNQLTVEQRTNVSLVFLNRIKEAGYTPMVYANMEMLSVLIDMESLEEFDKWFAFYDTSIYFPYEYAVWQYSEKGRVDGISSEVDLNISFKEW